MQQLIEAIQTGDYSSALALMERTPDAKTVSGAASAAFLLALLGRYEDAERRIRGMGVSLVEAIINGERARAARRTDVSAAGELNASTPLPYLGVYPGMAVAMIQNDTALVERIVGDMQAIPPVAGRLHMTDGSTKSFASLQDADDSIGQMLETYPGDGVLYVPLATVRRVDFVPARNFIDLLVPKVQIVDAHGQSSTLLMPLLYAGSSISDEPTIRAGRMTTFDYVGRARRAHGQRDFVLDGTRMVGMQGVAAIEIAA